MPPFRVYGVSERHRQPLLDFVLRALEGSGCKILASTASSMAPFQIAFETLEGERMGVVVYAFFANRRETRNRPEDEWRFQVKYGPKDGQLHEIWQDPTGLHATLLMGISPESGIFVGADPVLHSPTLMFISVEFKDRHVQAIQDSGWHAWERDRRVGPNQEAAEVLIGGTADSFLRYVRFERAAVGLSQGHRQLLAEMPELTERAAETSTPLSPSVQMPAAQLHELEQEFQLSPVELMNLIASAPRLKMAVRGWVAEDHLVRKLALLPGVTECSRLEHEGGPDVSLRFQGSRAITIECKNVLRLPNAAGHGRVDFQRTRASKSDPCSRFYRPEEFDILAACVHPLVQQWDFAFRQTWLLNAHRTCEGRLSSSVIVNDWPDSVLPVLSEVLSR